MPRNPDRQETYVFEVVRRVLGTEVEFIDDGRVDGVVDGHIVYSGRRDALEVTTIGDQSAIEDDAVLTRLVIDSSGLRWRWDVRFRPGVTKSDLGAHVPVLMKAAETQEVANPIRIIPYSQQEEKALEWLVGSRCSILGNPDTNSPGAVDVLPNGIGGAVDERMEGLCDWLAERLVTGHVADRVAKLNRSGLSYQHLFLIVHRTGMPFSLYDALAFGSSIPECIPDLPPQITDVWLQTGWDAGGILKFGAEGWNRHWPFNQ